MHRRGLRSDVVQIKGVTPKQTSIAALNVRDGASCGSEDETEINYRAGGLPHRIITELNSSSVCSSASNEFE
jgi:hypothetical protein